MEEVKLYIQLAGVDPASGADIRIARCGSTVWHKDIVAELINQVLDESEKFIGMQGLEGLRAYDVMLGIGLISSGIWPGFSLDPDTINRISDCGAALDFDPYIENEPMHTCERETHDDFTIAFSALGFHRQRSVIAIRALREYANVADVFIVLSNRAIIFFAATEYLLILTSAAITVSAHNAASVFSLYYALARCRMRFS